MDADDDRTTIATQLQGDAAAIDLAQIDVWPRIETTIIGQRDAADVPHRSDLRRTVVRRWGAIALGTSIALAVGLGAAVAESPRVQRLIADALPTSGVGISSDGAAVTGTSPALPFQVLNPTYIPAGLTVHQFTRLTGGVSGWSVSLTIDAPTSGRDVLPTGFKRINGVYLRFASPVSGGPSVSIIEQVSPTSQSSTDTGQRIAVGTSTAFVTRSGASTILTLTRSHTLITVQTDLGQGEAAAVATSLK